jgi:uncharacterized protein (TIGR02996 family)
VPRPELLAFLADCKEHPGDDTPRLVLADWLSENGDERGEFVRLQVRGGDEAREKELLERHRKAWLGVLGEKLIRTGFVRGLVWASGSKRKLLTKRLAAMKPREELAWVESLTLPDFEAADLWHLAASPHWGLLSALTIRRLSYYADQMMDCSRVGLSRGDWSVLPELPQLARLSDLDLSCQDIGIAGARALTAADLGRLRGLDLARNNLADPGAVAFGESRTLTGLVRLSLSQNRIRASGFAALAGWRGLSAVRRLNLHGNYPGVEGIAALAGSPCLGELTELLLTGPDHPLPESFGPRAFGPGGAAALAAAAGLHRLQVLRISRNAISPPGAEALAASKAFPALTELDLSENGIGDGGAVALARSPALAGLAKLDLRYNGIGDVGAIALAESPHLSGLTALNMRANWDVSPAAITRLRGRFGTAVDITDQSGQQA